MSLSPEATLQDTLNHFDTIDLVERRSVRRTVDIFETPSQQDERATTIYREKIDYLGNGVQLIVYRLKGAKAAPREHSQYAFYNDIYGVIQFVSIRQVLQFLKSPPPGLRLETSLEIVLQNAHDAQERTKIQKKRTI